MRAFDVSLIATSMAAMLIASAGEARGQTFLAANNYPTPDEPVHLTTGDFTGDGRLDVAMACNFAGQFAIFPQTAGGLLMFGGARNIVGSGHPVHVNAMQVNFLGAIDLVIADGTGPLQAYESDGTGNPSLWSLNASLDGQPVGQAAMFSTGFSIDGFANAVIGSGMTAVGGIQARVGDGDGTYEGFQQGPTLELGTGAGPMARGKLDSGPLDDDLAVCVSGSNIVKIMLFDGFVMCSDICWRGYSFTNECPIDVGEVAPPDVVVAANPIGVVLDHFDPAANAHTDMAVLCAGDNSVRILRGNGNGTFTATQTLTLGSAVKSIASGDLTGDNRADLAVCIDPVGTGVGSVVILVNNGAGTFSFGPNLTIPDRVRSITIADLSGDGRRDIAVVTVASVPPVVDDNLAVFRNSTTGCIANFDLMGGVGVPDIFAFLSAWFSQLPAADVDQNGVIAVPDIFGFLARWFGGC